MTMTTGVVMGIAVLFLIGLALTAIEFLTGRPRRWIPPAGDPVRVDPEPIYDWAREQRMVGKGPAPVSSWVPWPWLTGEHDVVCRCERCVDNGRPV